MKTDATISDDGLYRYDLTRRWADGPLALWIMLNPSTADASIDDPTIRRCIGFTRRKNVFGGLVVCNLFAYRATCPADVLDAAEAGVDPVGPANVGTLCHWLDDPDVASVICAWGANPIASSLVRPRIESLTERPLWCLGHTANGSPRHPLYVQADTMFVRWEGMNQ